MLLAPRVKKGRLKKFAICTINGRSYLKIKIAEVRHIFAWEDTIIIV